MSRITESRPAMSTTPESIPKVTAADHVKGPGQGNWTYEDYAAIPDDGKRYEVINGVLFLKPSPEVWHQEALGALFAYLWDHVKRVKLGRTYVSPLDVELAPKTIVQPDILLILSEHMDKGPDSHIVGVPDLVIEVLSAGTTGYDYREKWDAYAYAGVPEYWIVDPTRRTIELLVLENKVYGSSGIFQGKQTLPSKIVLDFPVHVEQFFT